MDKRSVLILLLTVAGPALLASTAQWTDVTTEAGLGQHATSRVKFADLNGDTWPDVIILPDTRGHARPVIYLHQGTATGAPYDGPIKDALPLMQRGDLLVFSDIDNDGHTDAIVGRYLDIYQEDYTPPEEPPTRTAILFGKGDGTFSKPVIVDAAQLATTRAIAVGDVNEDGLPDLFIGNWYERYFSGFEGFSNDLLLQFKGNQSRPAFVRWTLPDESRPGTIEDDPNGRPTYGVALPILDEGLPMLLELNYGRRWNRLYRMNHRQPLQVPASYDIPPPSSLKDPRAKPDELRRSLQGVNIAAQTHVDGDDIRHGRHPEWPTDHAEARPRSKRPDERPFRANGNTFDAAIGDIDNDGDFDLFVSTIIHAWAGDSSDRSRFLVNQLKETGSLDFRSFEHLSVDRIPEPPPGGQALQPVHTRYNQGDIYTELADLNHDGRLDLILCSSDYPDPPPHDERLRIYFQQEDGSFRDVTADLGIDHVGAGMPSLGDVDGDGDLDLLVGQSFNRLPAEQRRIAAMKTGAIEKGAPENTPAPTSVRLFLNGSPAKDTSIMLTLEGDPAAGMTRDAHGAIVRMTADLDGNPDTPSVTQIRQVLGPYGHSGKQHMMALHFGLGKATSADSVEILWPGSHQSSQTFTSVKPGHYRIHPTQSSLENHHE